jgi:hypothetical protein
LLTADSIGECKEPAMGLFLFGDSREHIAKIILVVAAYSPAVGSLSKRKVQH